MRGILKQTTWLFLAQGLTRAVGFFYTIYLARNLGISEFGLFSVALAYYSLISAITDFGFNRFLIREVALDTKKASELLVNITILRLTLMSVVFAIFAVAIYTLDPEKLRVHLILLAVLAVLPQSVAQTLDSVFVALKKLQFSAISMITLSLSTTIFGVYLISAGYSVAGAVSALTLGQLVYTLSLILLMGIQGVNLFSQVRFSILKVIVRDSLPYGVLGIIGLISFKIDTVILSYFRGNFDAGIYGAAYRFLEAVAFIPIALSTALVPILARLHEVNRGEISRLYFKSLKIMIVVALIVVGGYLSFLPLIINTFLPKYTASIEVIRILALAVPFMFMHVPSGQVLLATDKYLKHLIILYTVLMVINITLNLVFIPKFGYIGAAWLTVLSEVSTFAAFFLYLKKRVLV